MSDFKKALEHVLQNEGGYVNDPMDRGGETNYGITWRTAKEFGYEGSMKDIPMDVVERIYRTQYWDKLCCNTIAFFHTELASKVFDTGVNVGVSRAGKWLQTSINLLNRNPLDDLYIDGVIGAKTEAALSALDTRDFRILLLLFKSFQGNHYITLALKDDTQRRFIRGWIQRAL